MQPPEKNTATTAGICLLCYTHPSGKPTRGKFTVLPGLRAIQAYTSVGKCKRKGTPMEATSTKRLRII